MPGLGGQDLGDGCQPLWEVARPHCSLQSRQLWSPCWGRAVLSLPQGALRVAPGCLLCDLAQRKAWHLCLLGTHGVEHGAVPSLWGAELRTPELFQALPCGPGRGDSTGPSLGPPHCPPDPGPVEGGWGTQVESSAEARIPPSLPGTRLWVCVGALVNALCVWLGPRWRRQG